MGYYVSSMIGIRTGGVFAGPSNVEDMKARIAKIVLEMRKNIYEDGAQTIPPNLGDENGVPNHCMSKELRGHKGGYVVIAGVFNYWRFPAVAEFAKRLSKEFGTEVMVMSWDEERDEVQCNIFLAGKQLFEVRENPIAQIIRRVT